MIMEYITTTFDNLTLRPILCRILSLLVSVSKANAQDCQPSMLNWFKHEGLAGGGDYKSLQIIWREIVNVCHGKVYLLTWHFWQKFHFFFFWCDGKILGGPSPPYLGTFLFEHSVAVDFIKQLISKCCFADLNTLSGIALNFKLTVLTRVSPAY